MREGERERWRKGRQKNGDLVVFLRSCNSSIKCSVLFNLSSAWISHISLFPQFSAAELTFYIRVKIEDIRLPVFIFNLHTYTCIYTHSTSFSLIKLEERIFLCLKSFFFFFTTSLEFLRIIFFMCYQDLSSISLFLLLWICFIGYSISINLSLEKWISLHSILSLSSFILSQKISKELSILANLHFIMFYSLFNRLEPEFHSSLTLIVPQNSLMKKLPFHYVCLTDTLYSSI